MSEERLQEYLKNVFGEKLTDKNLEKKFLANPADAFAIYQLRNHESTRDYRFLPLNRLEAAGRTVDRANYEPIYIAYLTDLQNKTIPQLLSDIFLRFNLYRPEDFYGHSLSVSDVVALKIDGVPSAHYVDRYGFHELHGFLSDQPLKNAEMQMEDDYAMIDGIINNGRRDPECSSVAEQLRKVPDRKPKQPSKGKGEPSIE